MRTRIIIWSTALLISSAFFFKWYTSIPELFIKTQADTHTEQRIEKISEKYTKYKSLYFLLYGEGNNPDILDQNIRFKDGVWLVRSIDPTGSVSFQGPGKINGTIKGKGTVLLDFKNNLLLSIDALVIEKNITKLLPSFYLQDGKKMFYDLSDIEKIVDKNLWEAYKSNTLKDEKEVYSGFSDEEITQNLKTILAREPDKNKPGNTFFKKNLKIREILEDILLYMENTKKQNKCGDSANSCLRFVTNHIQEGKKIDREIFERLEAPLMMWGRKNSSIENDYSWESIFQRYHIDVLSNNQLAVNVRDNAIVTMIRASQKPTYEMWLYLTYILSKEKNGSPYSLQITTEMIRLGEILKEQPEHKEKIVEESNRALSQLRKVLEETYFYKKDNYLFVLKDNLKDENGRKIDTLIFVNDLNRLIAEIDKSTLFLEYPDFRILRRHLTWFTCIFLKNKEYLQDIRVCRGEL